MIIKYYLTDKIKPPFEDFAIAFQNVWSGPNGFSVLVYLLVRS